MIIDINTLPMEAVGLSGTSDGTMELQITLKFNLKHNKMSKSLCLNPVFMALRGNYTAQDEHGHKEVLRFRETSWGTKSFGLGANVKRDLSTNPYSDDELTQQSAFAAAAAKRKTINASATLKNTWRNLFKAALADGTTSCKTLGGYIMQQGLAGKIASDGSYAG